MNYTELMIADEGKNLDTRRAINSSALFQEVKNTYTSIQKRFFRAVFSKDKRNIYNSIKKDLETLEPKVVQIKQLIAAQPELAGIWEKICSAFTPQLAKIPKDELNYVMVIGNTTVTSTTTYVDSMSKNTNSNLKRRMQEQMNFLLHYITVANKTCDTQLAKLDRKEAKKAAK